MSEKVYIIGHKIPDLDSAAAAIALADLKNTLEDTDIYEAALSGRINGETGYILDKLGLSKPEIIEDIAGKKVILVDHNEFAQAVDGIEKAKIVEVVDHHKINFHYPEPTIFLSLPWGSTCSIVADQYFKNGVEMDKKMAVLLLAGILIDTVITKSPTCTETDEELIGKLSQISGIEDWRHFGMELFKVRAAVNHLSPSEIIKGDFKDFNFKAGKIGIGQVETVDLDEFASKEEELIAELKKIQEENNYHSVILFITDILKEGSKFFVATRDQEKIEEALGAKLENNRVYIDGVISRKKQVTPKLIEALDK